MQTWDSEVLLQGLQLSIRGGGAMELPGAGAWVAVAGDGGQGGWTRGGADKGLQAPRAAHPHPLANEAQCCPPCMLSMISFIGKSSSLA